jgi:hypothetical protein
MNKPRMLGALSAVLFTFVTMSANAVLFGLFGSGLLGLVGMARRKKAA